MSFDFVKTLVLAGYTMVWEMYLSPQLNSDFLGRLIGFTAMGFVWNGIISITDLLMGNDDPDGIFINSIKMGTFYMFATEVFTPLIGGLLNNDMGDTGLISNLVQFFILAWIWVGPMKDGLIILISKFSKERRGKDPITI